LPLLRQPPAVPGLEDEDEDEDEDENHSPISSPVAFDKA
jgi:hypothetical protein